MRQNAKFKRTPKNLVFKVNGQAQRLMPVIPTFWEAKVGRSLEVRRFRPAWSTR